MKRLKKISLITIPIILFIFICPFVCSIPKTSNPDSYNLSGLSYIGFGYYSMEINDELRIKVDSGAIINVYVMTKIQWNTLINSLGLTWNYKLRLKDITHIDYIFTANSNDNYCVVFYNKGVFSVFIEYTITYIPYQPEPNDSFLGWWVFIFIIIPAIIVGVGIALDLIIRHKRNILKEGDIKPDESKIQGKQIQGSKYCPECGTEILDKTKKFCSVCGNKIIIN